MRPDKNKISSAPSKDATCKVQIATKSHHFTNLTFRVHGPARHICGFGPSFNLLKPLRAKAKNVL